MTKDDIMALAREAGFVSTTAHPAWVRFVDLVAGVEREEILQMSRDTWFKTQADFEAAIAARWKHD